MGRKLDLDYLDGVKVWSLQLVPGEMGLKIGDVTYLDDEEEEESSDEEAMEQEEEEEEEEEGDQGGSKGRGRGTNGNGGGVRIKDGVKLPPKRIPPPMQVRLNKTAVKASGENEDNWDVEVPIGSHVLELGEKGGAVWKVYIQRM